MATLGTPAPEAVLKGKDTASDCGLRAPRWSGTGDPTLTMKVTLLQRLARAKGADVAFRRGAHRVSEAGAAVPSEEESTAMIVAGECSNRRGCRITVNRKDHQT